MIYARQMPGITIGIVTAQAVHTFNFSLNRIERQPDHKVIENLDLKAYQQTGE
jgi:hypothetical protein